MSDHTPAGRIHTALADIRDAWDDTLEPARRAAGSHVLMSMVNPPLPVSADVLDKRAKAHERLAWWSLQVIRGRKLHLLVAIDVKALTVFLQIHAAWLADFPKALSDLEGSAAELGVIAAQSQPRSQEVGSCPGTTDGRPCFGTVTATVRRDDDSLPSKLVCSGHPSHEWPAGEWRTLNRRLHANAKEARRLTAARGADVVESALRALVDAIHCDPRHTG
jgi:hypothetical protein